MTRETTECPLATNHHDGVPLRGSSLPPPQFERLRFNLYNTANSPPYTAGAVTAAVVPSLIALLPTATTSSLSPATVHFNMVQVQKQYSSTVQDAGFSFNITP
jgi:hypothetical protein